MADTARATEASAKRRATELGDEAAHHQVVDVGGPVEALVEGPGDEPSGVDAVAVDAGRREVGEGAHELVPRPRLQLAVLGHVEVEPGERPHPIVEPVVDVVRDVHAYREGRRGRRRAPAGDVSGAGHSLALGHPVEAAEGVGDVPAAFGFALHGPEGLGVEAGDGPAFHLETPDRRGALCAGEPVVDARRPLGGGHYPASTVEAEGTTVRAAAGAGVVGAGNSLILAAPRSARVSPGMGSSLAMRSW